MRFSISILCVFSIVAVSCMDSTPNYSACVKIETARCEVRDQCLGEGDEDFLKAYSDFDKGTCIAYAKEHCRTRKIVCDYKSKELNACVRAIGALKDGSCGDLVDGQSLLKDPETGEIPACWFLEKNEEKCEKRKPEPDTEETDPETETEERDSEQDTDETDIGKDTEDETDSGQETDETDSGPETDETDSGPEDTELDTDSKV